jgi:hypothetical protein
MTSFKVSVDSIKRIIALSSQGKEIASMTKPIFIVSDGLMDVNLFSNRNVMEFKVDISDYSRDTTLDASSDDFFSVTIDDFASTLSKVSNLSDTVEVSIDRTSNKITLKNSETGSKISLATYSSQVTPEEVTSAKTAFENLNKTKFAKTNDISITQEIIDFFDTCQKFMNVTLSSNAICINKSIAKYMDTLIILKKTLSNPVSDADKDFYIQKNLVSLLKPMIKSVGTVNAKFSEDDSAVLIESTEFGFKAAMGLVDIQFEYPTDEELVQFSPEETQEIKVSVKKEDLKKAFELFNGTFKAENWRFSNVSLQAPQDKLDAGKIHFEHSDFNAECFTDIDAKVISNTETAKDTNFLFSMSCLNDLLNVVSESEVTIGMNSLEADVPHGAGFTIETPTISAVCCKVAQAA